MLLRRAAVSTRALRDREFRVGLRGERAGLLAVRDGDVGEREEGGRGKHSGIEVKMLLGCRGQDCGARC